MREHRKALHQIGSVDPLCWASSPQTTWHTYCPLLAHFNFQSLEL